MGAGNSKPEGPPGQHVFSPDAPVRFSSSLIDSLQSSPEVRYTGPSLASLPLRPLLQEPALATPEDGDLPSDTTRARHLEAIVQQRVAAELSKLQKSEQDRLDQVQQQLSQEPEKQGASDSSLSHPLTSTDDKTSDLSREVVSKEIDNLKKKLAARKKVAEADQGVESAKEEVIACLRARDRRPLDCWQEVEKFGREVGRLEKEWIAKNAG